MVKTCTTAGFAIASATGETGALTSSDFGILAVTSGTYDVFSALFPTEDYDDDKIRLNAGMSVSARSYDWDGITDVWVAAATSAAELKGAVSGVILGASALLAVAAAL